MRKTGSSAQTAKTQVIKRNNSAPSVMDLTNQRTDNLLNLINSAFNEDVRDVIYNIKKAEAKEMRLIKNEVKIFECPNGLFITIQDNNTNYKGYYDEQSDDNDETHEIRTKIEKYVDEYQFVVPKQFTLLAKNASDYLQNKNKHVHTLVYYMSSYTPCIIYPLHNKNMLSTIQEYVDALIDDTSYERFDVTANTPIQFDSHQKSIIFMNKGFLKWLQITNTKQCKN